MKALRHFPIAPGRRMGALVCLLAVVMLWTPMWAAACQANGIACCSAGMCPAHAQSKTHPSGTQQSAPKPSPMDCEHHSGSGMAECSLSCCQESSHALTTALIFVLPEPAAVSEPAHAASAPAQFGSTEAAPSFDPPSPPPRTSLVSL